TGVLSSISPFSACLIQPGQLRADALDRVAVGVELGSRRAVRLEQRPHVHQPLQLQVEVLSPSYVHAASSFGCASRATTSSSSPAAGFDSSMRAESTAPSAASPART